METLLWGLLSGILLVEFLALSFRLNLWRRRADAIEHAALTYADTPDERTQEKLVFSAGLNLLSLVLYLWAILGLFFMTLTFIPFMAHIQDSVYMWSTSGAFIAYVWLRATWLDQRKKTPNSVNPYKVGYTRIARWLHWIAI